MSRPSSVRAALLAAVLLAAGCQPHGPEALRRGDELLRAGKAADAIPLLERAASDLSADPRAWNFLGLAYHAAGRPAEAQKAYLRALRENRDFFEAHYNLGVLHVESGDWAEAERSLRTFLAPEANRGHPVASHLLGRAQLQLRKFDEAERNLALAAKLMPKSADVWNDLGLVQSGKRHLSNARQDFAWAVRLDPRHAAARLNLAVTLQQLGDKRAAFQAYRDFLVVAPDAPEAEGVRALIRQLEAPPAAAAVAPAATNSVAAAKLVTNAAPKIPAVASSPVVTKPATSVVPVPVVAPKPVPAKPVERVSVGPANAPPATNKSEVSRPVIAAPPPEVVQVADAPPLQPARDIVPPSGPAIVSPASDTAQATAVADPDVSVPATSPDDLSDSSPAAERRGFWQRVNPVRWANPVKWFRSEPKPEKAATPLQVASARRPTTADTLPLPETAIPAPVIPTPVPKPTPPKPVVVRYTPRAPATLPSGDRAEAERQFNAAVAAHDRRDLPTALALYQRSIAADPSYFAAQHNLGLAALENNDLPRALLAGECSTRLDPKSIAAQRLFAATLQRANYPADAAEHLERLVALDPTDVAAHLALAGLYARSLGEPSLARPHYERVLALKPDHPQAGLIRVWLSENR